ncbi:MAG: hypothetical protein K0Q59_4625 [Paenibacillus sp.]|jgi:predicted GH43/DUF377 family glycosyl hydrolase|nr:hypothetical protein [Paenibacillus sp.]
MGKLKRNTTWVRDARNPILPPQPGSDYDCGGCMNPWIIQEGDRYYLYYAGWGADRHRRICLATAPAGQAGEWERQGPALPLGEHGEFDGNWCVLPHVIKLDEREWRLYYTGNSGIGTGLDMFPGLGMAFSEDGKQFAKHDRNPIIARTGQEGDPDQQGIAGGSVIQARLPDGTVQWRFYYTGCPTLGKDVFLNQQKRICLAISQDGIEWEKQGAIMQRDPLHDYENVAVAGPVVQQLADGSYRMWYSAIGTRWGFYSICYAESDDGITWNRGTHYGDNLQLGPRHGTGGNWESMMVEYPSVIEEDGRLRLFYTGNNYGLTGIGTAVSTRLRATADHDGAHIASSGSGAACCLRLPEYMAWGGAVRRLAAPLAWQGPDANGMIWYEQTIVPGLQLRAILTHGEQSLGLQITVMNQTGETLQGLKAGVRLTALDEAALPAIEWAGACRVSAESRASSALAATGLVGEMAFALELDVLADGGTATITGTLG